MSDILFENEGWDKNRSRMDYALDLRRNVEAIDERLRKLEGSR